MEIFIGWLVFSFVAAAIAAHEGRSAVGYFLLSVLLSPLIGIICALVTTPNVQKVEAHRIASGENKKCPYCAELIKREAKVCRYCGRDVFAPQLAMTDDSPKASTPISNDLSSKNVHIHANGTAEGPYSEAEVKRRLRENLIPRDAFYWCEGMHDWRSVRESDFL